MGAVLVAFLLPLGAVTGSTRPYVTVDAASGQWDSATGDGWMELRVVNQGMVAATVTSADSTLTTMTVDAPVRIPAHGDADVLVRYRITCDEAPDDTMVGPDGPALSSTIHVRGAVTGALDYDIGQLAQTMLPTASQCAG